VTLFFDAANCPALSDSQKKRILKRLASRADKKGVIRVASQKFRTQRANRNAATERLQGLLAEALKAPRIRKQTRIPPSAQRKRLDEKKRRGALKRLRSEKDFEL
jgi:ribosome-associated protein